MLTATILVLYAYPLYIFFCLIKHRSALCKGNLQILTAVSFINYINNLKSSIFDTCKWLLIKLDDLLSTIYDSVVALISTLFIIMHPMLSVYVFNNNNSDHGDVIFIIHYITLLAILLITINTKKQSRDLKQLIDLIKNNKIILIIGFFVLLRYRQIIWSYFALGIDIEDVHAMFCGAMLNMISVVFITLYTIQMLPELIKLICISFYFTFFCYMPPLDAFFIAWDSLDKKRLSILSIKFSIFHLLFLVISFGLMQFIVAPMLIEKYTLGIEYISQWLNEVFNLGKSYINNWINTLYNTSKNYLHGLLGYLSKCYMQEELCLLKTRYGRRFIYYKFSKCTSVNAVLGSSLKEKAFLLAMNKLYYNDLYNKIFFFKPLHSTPQKSLCLDHLRFKNKVEVMTILENVKLAIIKWIQNPNVTAHSCTVKSKGALVIPTPNCVFIMNGGGYMGNLRNILPYFEHDYTLLNSFVETPNFSMYSTGASGDTRYILYPNLAHFRANRVAGEIKRFIDIQAVINHYDTSIISNGTRPFMLRQLNSTHGEDLLQLISHRYVATEKYHDLDHLQTYNCTGLSYYWRSDIMCSDISDLPTYVYSHYYTLPDSCLLLSVNAHKIRSLVLQGTQVLVEGKPAIILRNRTGSSPPMVSIVIPVSNNVVKAMPADIANLGVSRTNSLLERRLGNDPRIIDRPSDPISRYNFTRNLLNRPSVYQPSEDGRQSSRNLIIWHGFCVWPFYERITENLQGVPWMAQYSR